MNIRSKKFLCITILIVVSALTSSIYAMGPAGVSPGAKDKLTRIEGTCPTFSWEAAEGTLFYELVTYALPSDLAEFEVFGVDLRDAEEILYTTVPGGATAWTASLDEGLKAGVYYVWFVRAVTRIDREGNKVASEWSEGRYFSIPARPTEQQVTEALEILRAYAEFTGDSVLEDSSAAEVNHNWSRNDPSPKNTAAMQTRDVTSAPAAIRGEHQETTTEAYGVVGSSDSPLGAGIAAVNTVGGADVVLDGSANGNVDTELNELGIDRPSATAQTFSFDNSGGGGMTIDVGGVAVVTTATDQDTTYANGTGLSLSGTTFSVNTSVIQSRVNSTCAPGAAIRAININGTVTCENDDVGVGDITSVLDGAGLSGGGTSGDVTLNVADLGITTGMLADNSVTTGKLEAGAVGTLDVGIRPSVRAYNTGQSLLAGVTNAQFHTEDWDVGGFHAGSTLAPYFFPPEPGLYLVTATLAYNGSLDFRREARLKYLNADQSVTLIITSQYGNARTVSLSTVYAFQGDGDRTYVELFVSADETMASVVQSNLTMTWIAPLP